MPALNLDGSSGRWFLPLSFLCLLVRSIHGEQAPFASRRIRLPRAEIWTAWPRIQPRASNNGSGPKPASSRIYQRIHARVIPSFACEKQTERGRRTRSWWSEGSDRFVCVSVGLEFLTGDPVIRSQKYQARNLIRLTFPATKTPVTAVVYYFGTRGM